MKRITLYEFNRLPEQEQFDITFNYGSFIDYHLAGNKRFALYAIDLFFVEVEYDVRSNKIRGKESFKTGKRIERYAHFNNNS